MSMLFKSYRQVEEPKSPPKFGSDTRLSGADQLIRRDTETVAWLAKCYAEMLTDKRRWPIFSEKRLGAFLSAIGVDLDAQVKAVDEPLGVPDYCDSMEQSMSKFYGASFLAKDAHEVCAHLRSRRARERS
jgi:hypothetical protein